MKILFICESDHYRDWKGKTYRDIMIHYKNNSKNEVTIIYTDSYIDSTVDYPDVIVFFDTDILRFGNKFHFLFDLKSQIFASGLDLFYFNRCTNCEWIKKCDGILHFGHSSKVLNSYARHFKEKTVKSFKGRFINSTVFKNYHKTKKYDVLIYGTRYYNNDIEPHDADKEYVALWEANHDTTISGQINFYPLRHRLENLLIKHTDKYNTCILKSKCIYDAEFANGELSELINQSWLTIACRTRADIPMAKYFEISASYSGILGDIPSDYTELFKGNIIEVSEWMSDEEILAIIDNALEDKQKLQEMINRLGDMIHAEYNLDAGVKDMDAVFDELL